MPLYSPSGQFNGIISPPSSTLGGSPASAPKSLYSPSGEFNGTNPSPTPNNGGITQPSPISKMASGIVQDTNVHAGNIAQDITEGEQGVATQPNPIKAVAPAAQSGLRIAGEVAGEVGDFFGEPLKAVASAALTPRVKQGLSTAVQKISGTPEAQQVLQAWKNLQAQHPDEAKNIGSAVNIAGLFGGAEAGEAAGVPTAEEAIQSAKEAVPAIKEVAGNLGQGTVDMAKSIGEGTKNIVKAPISIARDAATPIDKNVMTVLKNPTVDTEKTLKSMFSQAKSAVSETGVSTPFDVAGKERFSSAMDSLDSQLKGKAQIINDTLKSKGSLKVPMQDSADLFNNGIKERLGSMIDEEGNISSAPGRTSLISNNSSDSRLLKNVQSTLNDVAKNPTLQKVDDAIGNLQSELYKAKSFAAEPINSKTEGLMKEVIYNLNNSAKEVGGTGYAEAKSGYSSLKSLRDDLNTRLGKNYKNAGSIMKRIFSPQDGGTKTLITNLEAQTGEPIFHDATLAKFAMDSVGDPRALSLLDKAANLKSGSFIQSTLRFLKDKLTNPEEKALGILQKVKK